MTNEEFKRNTKNEMNVSELRQMFQQKVDEWKCLTSIKILDYIENEFGAVRNFTFIDGLYMHAEIFDRNDKYVASINIYENKDFTHEVEIHKNFIKS